MKALHFSSIEKQKYFQIYKVFDINGIFLGTAVFVGSRISTGKPWLFRDEWVEFPLYTENLKSRKNFFFRLKDRMFFNPYKHIMKYLIFMMRISKVFNVSINQIPPEAQKQINLFKVSGVKNFFSVN